MVDWSICSALLMHVCLAVKGSGTRSLDLLAPPVIQACWKASPKHAAVDRENSRSWGCLWSASPDFIQCRGTEHWLGDWRPAWLLETSLISKPRHPNYGRAKANRIQTERGPKTNPTETAHMLDSTSLPKLVKERTSLGASTSSSKPDRK